MRNAPPIVAVEPCFVGGLLLMAALAAGACQRASTNVVDRLHACAADEGPVDSVCGRLRVENPVVRTGRTIDLKIVVAPALRRDAAEPLFVLQGGPGGGAATQASSLMVLFRRFQTDRDIVFVDQRGSGGSHSLDCEPEEGEETTLAQLDEQPLDRFHACLKELDADLLMYTTPLAMDDLDEVRRHLGTARSICGACRTGPALPLSTWLAMKPRYQCCAGLRSRRPHTAILFRATASAPSIA